MISKEDGKKYSRGEMITVRCISLPPYDQHRFTIGKSYRSVVENTGEAGATHYVSIISDDNGEAICIGMFGSGYIMSFEIVGECVSESKMPRKCIKERDQVVYGNNCIFNERMECEHPDRTSHGTPYTPPVCPDTCQYLKAENYIEQSVGDDGICTSSLGSTFWYD